MMNPWTFYEKELQKTSQEKFRVEKLIKRKGDKLYVKWKGYDSCFIKMSQYFPKPFRSFGRNINVKVDLSNYATKTDLKNVTHVDTSSFALKTNSASLKTEFNKWDINKLAPVLLIWVNWVMLLKMMYDKLKKTVFDKLAAKVNDIDTSEFVLKTKYQTEKAELQKKSWCN